LWLVSKKPSNLQTKKRNQNRKAKYKKINEKLLFSNCFLIFSRENMHRI
jgi:hypothetical protein